MLDKTDSILPLRSKPSGSGFVAFRVSGQELLLKGQKVSGVVKATEIRAHLVQSDLVRCVVSVAGNVIPVVDLAPRLGLPPSRLSEKSCLIFAQALGIEIGIMVDGPPDLLNTSQKSSGATHHRQPEQSSSTRRTPKAKQVPGDLDSLVGPENLGHLQAVICENSNQPHDSLDGKNMLLPVAYSLLTLQSLKRACGELSELLGPL